MEWSRRLLAGRERGCCAFDFGGEGTIGGSAGGPASAVATPERDEEHRIAAPAVASYGALPETTLARSARLPASGGYAYEVKWDGFHAIVSTEGRCVCAVAAAGT
jgi:hypothetical protein